MRCAATPKLPKISMDIIIPAQINIIVTFTNEIPKFTTPPFNLAQNTIQTNTRK